MDALCEKDVSTPDWEGLKTDVIDLKDKLRLGLKSLCATLKLALISVSWHHLCSAGRECKTK